MQEFGFNPSDLAANRAGQLSAGQREQLEAYLHIAGRRAGRIAALALGSPVALMALLYLLEGDPGFLRACPSPRWPLGSTPCCCSPLCSSTASAGAS